jgi:hypothetical protein
MEISVCQWSHCGYRNRVIITELGIYTYNRSWSNGKVFFVFRYQSSYIWLAETNRAREVLVLIDLCLALVKGFWVARGNRLPEERLSFIYN